MQTENYAQLSSFSGPNTYWPVVVNSNEATGSIHEVEAFGVALVNVQVLNGSAAAERLSIVDTS